MVVGRLIAASIWLFALSAAMPVAATPPLGVVGAHAAKAPASKSSVAKALRQAKSAQRRAKRADRRARAALREAGRLVTGPKILDDAVTSADIAADAIHASEIAAGSVGSSEIAAGAVGSSEIADNAVRSAEILNNTIVGGAGGDIAADTITAGELAADAVGTSEIAPDAVGTSELAPDAVGTSELAPGAVTSAEIAPNSIAPEHITMLDPGSSNVTWSAMQDAETEFNSSPRYRTKYDLSNASQVRIVVRVQAVSGASAPLARIGAQYSTDQSSWSYLNGASGPNVDVSSSGTKDSAWANLAAGAKNDVYVRLVGLGGNGANFDFGQISIQVR